MKTDLLEDVPVQMVPAKPPAGDPFIDMIERVASNPAVDVEKLGKIIDLQRGILRDNAKAAFDAAFAKMQLDLPEVTEKGKITVKEQVRSTYARLEDIQAAIKPVLKQYGFAIRHRTEWPAEKIIRIVGILSHEQGHSEESAFEAPMDRSEYRTDIQSMGSTVSYGRRYTTLDLLNITTRGADDDGQKAGRPQPPDGYDAWVTALRSVAEDGKKAYDEAWAKSKTDLRNFMVAHDKTVWAELKAKAGYTRG